MWKKSLYVSLAILVCSSSAMAIEMRSTPAVIFNNESTAYSSNELNLALAAHGASLAAQHTQPVPASYADVNSTAPVFHDLSTAYSPRDYHQILTAYGLELTPENAGKILVHPYIRVVGDEIVFDDNVSTLYTKSEWHNILSAYTPVKADEVAAVAAASMIDSDGDGDPDIRDQCPNTPEGVSVSERGCWEYSSSLLFGLDKAEINPEYYVELNDIRKILRLNPGLKLVVEGHTCSLGTRGYNKGLSERRAKAVVDYLVEKAGVDPDFVTWVGHGEDQPAFSNDTEEGRAKNRRVQLKRLE